MTALEDALRRALSGDKAPDPVRDLIARGLAGNTESTTDNTPEPSAPALNSPTLEATILAGLTNTEEQ